MYHNTIALDVLQKFGGYFQGSKRISMWRAWTLPEIWRDLHPCLSQPRDNQVYSQYTPARGVKQLGGAGRRYW